MIRKTTIIGMGALGLLYANQIMEKQGKEAVEFVMDAARVRKYNAQTFTTNGVVHQYTLTAVEDAKPADLVIVAVKYPALQSVLDIMRNSVDERTIILSVMNGITSEKIIGECYGPEKLLYTVAQGMDAMKFGTEFRYTHMGELRIGVADQQQTEKLKAVADYFNEVEIPYTVDADILRRMWCKFMLNVGINQVCMVYGTTYSGAMNEGETNRILIAAMREVRAIAQAEGMEITEADLTYYVKLVQTLDPNGMPSMAQDRVNKKPCEVDMFAGAVIEIAFRHDIYVPANEYLYKRAKEIEQEYL